MTRKRNPLVGLFFEAHCSDKVQYKIMCEIIINLEML